MHGQDLFFQALVYLGAAVVAVPVAKRLGLGSVLGYLAAGVAVGPFALGLVGDESRDVMHFAEFGVVLMLFLIGLELQPTLLWRLRRPILGTGGLQVALTAAAIAGLGIAYDLPWQSAVAIGLTLALSSTAIVLQSLAEKDLLKSDGGQHAFAVLLFQDIAVIPMLAVLPLLAPKGAAPVAADHPTWVSDLAPWLETLLVAGAIATVVLGGRFLLVPLLRFVARARLREMFTASALLLVIAIALLMAQVGLSPALGSFLAGVVLANSEYRHELEGDIEPFKGLLLGLFFISVGASVDFALIGEQPGFIAAAVIALVVVKLVLLLGVARLFRMGTDQALLFSFALAQGGEFAFVLFSFAVQQGVIETELGALLVAVVAVSMALTPLLMLLTEKVLLPRVGTMPQAREADDIHGEQRVIIAGYGRFGNIVGRLFSAAGVDCTVLDTDSDHVDLLRSFGAKVFYGDASREELLRAAGAEQAEVLVIAVDDPEKTLAIVEVAKRHFPHLKLFARAVSRTHAYELLDAGLDHVYRETLDSSLSTGVDALRALGVPGYHATRTARAFRRHDERILRELAEVRHDRRSYMSRARQGASDLEALLRSELDLAPENVDEGWDVSSLRAEAEKRATESTGGG